MAKLIGGTTVEGLLTVDSNIETDEGDVILDSSNNTIALGVLPTGSGNGLNADLLDGKHAGAFVLDTGDTISGSLGVGGVSTSQSTDAGTAGASNAVGAPWMYSSAIEAHTERGGSSTLIEMGSEASRTAADEIALVTQGNTGLLVDSSTNVQVPNSLYESGNRVATRTWAQNTAKVNDSDLLDGQHASAFADSGHTHDGRYYTESESDSNFAASGHLHDNRYILESGDTMGGVLTLSDGSTAASRSWVNGSADVPNADYADNAGDADTVGGRTVEELAVAQSSASFTSTDTTTDINQTSWTQIPWDVEKNIDAPYTHDPANSPEQITFDEAGTYQVYASISYDSTNARQNPGVAFSINGTPRNARGLSGYSRHASGHEEASNSLMETINVSAGDTLRVETLRYGNSGTATLRSEESKLEISSITTRTASTTDADTVDGEHASAFFKTSGGSVTGNLNASDSITVSRNGSQMDSNNSIESNGNWLGLDSNSVGNGVLIGYYNAPEIRLGNGGIDIDARGTLMESGSRVATRTWANNNADVPNADYADSAGDADTVDGNHAGAFANSGHNHDGRYVNDGDAIPHPVYASTTDVPALNEGESVYISGDGLYVEDGT